MKRRGIYKTVQLVSALALLAIAILQPFALQPGGVREAYADAMPCTDAPIAPGRSFSVQGGQATTVSNDDASLVIGTDVLTASTVLTITPLRGGDVPALHQGMTNVTNGPRCGYRFEPHPARFAAKMQVSIPYNRGLIPPGLTEHDIKTFYFDDVSGSWKELERVRVDTQGRRVISLTDHFTNMINATVAVPDHPQPQSNNPTSMKDIKAADPGSGINLIEAPQANNKGDARLSYPIDIPPGRGGMQPNIEVSYNSGGPNGWLGVGWDIPLKAITVDTRWGVPRYDNGQLVAGAPKETETYMLNGEQLAPVFNRGALVDRVDDRVFHTRVEGEFRKIIRHGTDPTDYWWEVIDKNGTRYFYGGDPETNGPRLDSTLRDGDAGAADTNIFKWALREIRDTNNNTIVYNYDLVDGGGAGSGERWHQIYLSSIRYTGTAGATGSVGPYEIKFNRESGRLDATTDARPGFKTVLDQRLANIEVRQPGATSPLIRRYVFQYAYGQFNKSLLTRVTQYGASGGEFNHHDFDYYNDVVTGTTGVLQGFNPQTVSFGGAEYVEESLLVVPARSTSLHADNSTSNQGSASVGIGFLGVAGAGVKGGIQGAGTDTKLALLDLNGDGLLDQVFERGTPSPGSPACGKSFFYRPNTGGPGSAPNFGPEVRLPSLESLCAQLPWWDRAIGHEGSATYSLDEHGRVGPIGANHENQWTDTTGEIYMTDVNADMLPDLVVRRNVHYNRLVDGVPTFNTQSPTPLEAGTTNTAGIIPPIPDAVRDQMEEVYHLVDPVRRWTAPYSGTVSITGQVRLLNDAPQSYTTADGVRASIQHNGTVLWTTTISNPHDLAARPIAGLSSVQVNRGDNIYFRVNSRDDGMYDAVAFDPTITYNGVDTTRVDENGMPLFVYNASSDFAYGGIPLDMVAPITGTATLSGTLVKDSATTDDVTLTITQSQWPVVSGQWSVIHQQTLDWDQTGSFPVNLNLATLMGSRIRVRIESDSRIDITGIHFAPRLEYDTIMGQPAPVDENGDPAIVLAPPVTTGVFPQTLGVGGAAPAPYQPWVVPSDLPTSTLQLRVQQAITVTNPSIPSTYTTSITLGVKRPGELIAKQRVDIQNGVISGTNRLDVQFPVERGDILYFEADAAAPDAFNMVSLSPLNLTIQTITNTVSYPNVPYDLHAGMPAAEAFGGGFRGWWYGQYNGRNAAAPIDETELRLPVDAQDEATDYFVQMIPFVDQGHWRIQDEDCWISATDMSASRFGLKNLDLIPGSHNPVAGARGVIRVGGAENEGGSFQVGFAGGSGASGANWSQLDFLDFNGDNYPDVVGGGKLQPTLPNGALLPAPAPIAGCAGDCSKVRTGKTESVSVNVGSAVSRQVSDSEGDLEAITTDDPSYSISLGVLGSTGNFRAQADLIDINGDGLPDLVRQGNPAQNQNGLQVQLNLGYRFGAVEEWAAPATECTALLPAPLPPVAAAPRSQVRCQKSISLGASFGLGGGGKTPDFGFSLGAGASGNLSMSNTQQELLDVNGDGLADIVSKQLALNPIDPQNLAGTLGSSAPLVVRFNTGTGFTAPVTYAGALNHALRANVTHTLNVGANAGISIPLPFCAFLCSLDLGGSYNHGRMLGGFSATLTDLDGDRYADHVYSDTGGNVTVSLNKHGRTNMLKTVRRPLGGRIDLEYERAGNTTDDPGSHWVLSRVATYDGHPGDGDVVLPPPPGSQSPITVTQVTTIGYEGGKFDRAEREFYGFRTVTIRQHDPANAGAHYRSVVRTYKNDTYYGHGLLESEVTRDAAGRKFTETINTFETVTVAAGRGGALEDFTAVRFPRLTRTEQRFFEGQAAAGKTTATTYGYDQLGNVTRYVETGDTGAEDDVTAAITYHSCPANYVVGKAKEIVVSANGAEMRHRDSTISCATGNITRVLQYLDDDTFAQYDLEFYPNGNLQTVTGPANADGQRYEIGYTYDTVVNTHITGITDSFGYSSAATYNIKFGQVETKTDVNNNRTSFTYDQYGRVETVKGPYEQAGSLSTIAFEYHPEGATPWALTRHLDSFRDPSGVDTINTVLFTDGFSRVIQTKKDGTLFAGRTSAAQNVMLVSGKVKFDFVGRAVEQYYPVTEPLNAATLGVFNGAQDTITPTLTTYDVLDRVTTTTLPDGTAGTMTYGFGEDRGGTNQFLATVEDANHNRSNTYKDVRGLVTAVQEFHTPEGGSRQSIWTSYAYNPLKELVEVRDDEDNVTSVTYDNLGRRTSIDNPDTGRTDMAYDLASNLVAKITANLRAESKQIVYDYDFTRLSSITYPNFPGNNVTYTYGAAGAPENRAGRITSVSDESGTEERFYGKLGEITREVKTVRTDTGPGQYTYTTSYTYDTWGRMQNMTYPDGEVLTYRYDAGGQPRQATGQKGTRSYSYVDRMEYDKFEQLAFLKDSNGIESLYTYRPDNRRLANLEAGQGDGNAFQDLSYVYDAVGNVLSLSNDVPVAPPSQFGGPTTQTFTYDDLYRLTDATGTYQFMTDKTREYELSMQYDTLNNIVSKVQADNVVHVSTGQSNPQRKTTYNFAYAYNGTQPHAPTQITGRNFTYDANGNQTGWTDDQNGQSRDIVWDEENRIQSIADNGHQLTYKYNHGGTRVIKRGPQGETVYVNPYFVVRNGQIGTKHVYMGKTRVVSKLMKRDMQTEEGDRYFFHPDHLGSSNYVTDATGHLYEHLEYFPFGETWVEEASNTQRTPYLYTSKEMDEETGLYDFGARYYDPRTSVWASPDPALPAYLSGEPNGGAFNPINLSLYTYGAANPLKYKDPNGLSNDAIKQTVADVAKQFATTGKVSVSAAMKKGGDSVDGKYGYAGYSYTVMGGQAQLNRKGLSASGSVASLSGEGVLGNKWLGAYAKGNVAVDKVEVKAGVTDGNVGAKAGASVAEGSLAVGVQVLGFRIGPTGSARLGGTAGAQIGKDGVKLDGGPLSGGADWGMALGPGEHPLVELWNMFKDVIAPGIVEQQKSVMAEGFTGVPSSPTNRMLRGLFGGN
ncbi:MAG TPA: SpvB/TcaC N-terminal domain-containing protein [Chloroflexia bacterium]|nr:SpvB/TcaC N-terminal domain-containing protein [Chloroflexia bacterium]